MDLALVGTGKTGRAIERIAIQSGHNVVLRFNSSSPVLSADTAQLAACDAIIDFSRPELALTHIDRYCKLNLRAVVGTTGWYDQLPEVEQHIQKSAGAILYAPNFSIGVAVLSRMLAHAARLFNKIPDYDAGIHEVHHRRKLDSPSGTALHLANILLESLDQKQDIATETQHQQIPDTRLHVSSQRTGHVFGRHVVTFDGPYDQIQLLHDAKNRDGFAFGAVRAAEWLIGKQGLFTLDDLLSDWLKDGK